MRIKFWNSGKESKVYKDQINSEARKQLKNSWRALKYFCLPLFYLPSSLDQQYLKHGNPCSWYTGPSEKKQTDFVLKELCSSISSCIVATWRTDESTCFCFTWFRILLGQKSGYTEYIPWKFWKTIEEPTPVWSKWLKFEKQW